MAAARLRGICAACWLVTGLVAEPLPLMVTGDRVILRATPESEGEIVGQLHSGDLLYTPDLLTSQEWVRVAAPPSVDLWLYSELLQDGRVAVNRVQVRAGPGVQFQRVGQLERAAEVEIRGRTGDWTRIAPPPGSFLWINRSYVAPLLPQLAAPEPQTAAAVALPEASDAVVAHSVPPATIPPATTLDESIAATTAAAESRDQQVDPLPPELHLPAAPAVAVATVTAPPPAPPPAAVGSAPHLPALPPLPRQLRGYVADAHRPQYITGSFAGVLKRAALRDGRRYSSFQIVASEPGQRPQTLCRLVGFEGQLENLRNCRVVAEGRLWHLAGEALPVLDLRRMVLSHE